MTDKQEYAFIHIPKCAGSSVYRSIITSGYENKIKIFYHWNKFSFSELNDYKEIIIIRNPIERFTSAFFFLKQMFASHKKVYETPDQLIDGLLNFDELAFNFFRVHNFKQTVNLKPINTDYVFSPQSIWINNPKIIMIHEKLNGHIERLNSILDIKLNLLKLNQSNKMPFSYSDRHIDFLRLFYQQDFELYDKFKHYGKFQ